jgi:hypothetical protein
MRDSSTSLGMTKGREAQMTNEGISPILRTKWSRGF